MGHEGHAVTAQQDSNLLKLSVANLGPIAGADIELRPMTVFVGPSNTGKSYLAILVYALHRFFSNHYQQSIRLGGDSAIERSLRAELLNAADADGGEIDRLARWTADAFPPTRLGGPNPEVQGRLPEFVASLLRPILRDMSGFDVDLANEVRRDFGTPDVRRLRRNGSRGGLQVRLKSFSSTNLRAHRTLPSTISTSAEEAHGLKAPSLMRRRYTCMTSPILGSRHFV